MAKRTSMLSVVAAMVDGVQAEGASLGRIIHDTFDMLAHATSAIAIWNSLRSSDDWTIADNLFTGAGFTLYAQDYSGPRNTSAHSRCVGVWGAWFFRRRWPPYFEGPTDLWNVGGSLRSGNVVLETGPNIDRGGPDGCEGANTSPAAPASPITPPTAAPPASHRPRLSARR